MRFVVKSLVLGLSVLMVGTSPLVAELNVVPRPQEMRFAGQPMPLSRVKVVFPEEMPILSTLWQETLTACRVSAFSGTEPAFTIRFLRPGSAESEKVVKSVGREIPDQGYVIRREGGELQLAAKTSTGLVYGLYTLEQLIEGAGETAAIQPADIVDWPDFDVRGILYLPPQIDRLAYLRYLARFKLNYGAYYVDETVPLSPETGKVIADLADRGMKVVMAMSWFESQRFRYADEKYVNGVLDRVRELGQAGGKAVCLNFDDIPCELKYEQDRAKYKTLHDAHIDLMKKVWEAAKPYGMEVFFTPTIYWPVTPGRQGNSLETQETYQREIARRMPPQIKIFNTGESVADWRKVEKSFGGRKWVMFNNFFPNDMCERKIYFRPYQVLPDEGKEMLLGVWVLGACGPTEIYAWYPNWISEAANTWNRGKPIGFREMFAEVYGPRYSDRLARMAELIATEGEDGSGLGGMQLELRNQILLALRGRELRDRLERSARAVEILEAIRAEEGQEAAASQSAKSIVKSGFYKDLPVDMLLSNAQRLNAIYRLAGHFEKLQSCDSDAQARRAELEKAGETIELLNRCGEELGLGNVDIGEIEVFKRFMEKMAENRSALVRRCRGKTPVVDGEISAGEYGEPVAQNFRTLGSLSPAKNPTTVWAGHDGEKVYLAVKCMHPEMKRIKMECTGRDSQVFTDDSVELFICPDPADRRNIFQVVFNARGGVFDKHKDEAEWNSGAVAKGRRLKDGWEAEIVIPVKSFGLASPLSSGREWYLNICRNAVTAGEGEGGEMVENSSWGPILGHSYYSPISMIRLEIE